MLARLAKVCDRAVVETTVSAGLKTLAEQGISQKKDK